MDILALDLGTKTGYAYNKGENFYCATLELASAREIRDWGRDRQRRTRDPRIERLCETVTRFGRFDIVVFEDVEFASSTYQVQLWSSLRAAIWICAAGAHFDCVPVGTLKKFATGSGTATKEAMKRFAKKTPLFPTHRALIPFESLDDNAIDSAWAWAWAKETFARMKI